MRHTINSLASTILNMKMQSASKSVQINTLQNSHYGTRHGNKYVRNNSRPNKSSPTSHNSRQPEISHPVGRNQYRSTYRDNHTRDFDRRNGGKFKNKGQCRACKIYGHSLRDCRLIAPYLAMKNFEKDNPKLCKDILQNHIQNNTEDYKRTIIRTMQTMGILNDDEDSDYYLDNEDILDIPSVNKVSFDDNNSDTNIHQE